MYSTGTVHTDTHSIYGHTAVGTGCWAGLRRLFEAHMAFKGMHTAIGDIDTL